MHNSSKLSVCLFVIAIIIQHNLVKCAFLDLTDIDDPLALLWNTKGTITAYKNQKCTAQVDGAILTGQCLHYSHCILTGGRPSGLCGILSTCCIYDIRSCSKTTNNKMSYFESGLTPLIHSDCTYTINRFSNNICQTRLDFEVFELSETTETAGSDITTASTYFYQQCDIDYLSITPNPFNESIPKLCGHNNQQHLYIHWDQSVKQVQLNIHLGSRLLHDTAIPNPQWRIRVTQLECPLHWNLIKHNNYVIQDYPALAPPGVIQYFTDPIGEIRSFNLDSSRPVSQKRSATTWTNYGIAIRKPTTACQVKFTNSYLWLPGNVDDTCSSYLFVPGLDIGASTDPLISNKYELCSSTSTVEAIRTPFSFAMKTNGPFNLEFVTNVQADSLRDLGFDIAYEVVSC